MRGLAASLAAGAAIVMLQLFGGNNGKLFELVQAGLASIAAGLAYAGVALALRIPELPSMISIVTDLVRRRR